VAAVNESWNSWRLRIIWRVMMVVSQVTATWGRYSGLTAMFVCGVLGSVPVRGLGTDFMLLPKRLLGTSFTWILIGQFESGT